MSTLFSFVLLSVKIEKDPGVIIGPILAVMGFIIDALYNLVYLVSHNAALGMSVILLTIIARSAMLPLAFKSQKSMTKMQMLMPQVEAIKKKYGDSKDPEIQRKIQMEQQALYTKNKVNPLTGCLPMLFTLPIFFALSALFRQTYRYIGKIGDIYTELSGAIMRVPDYIHNQALRDIVYDKLPKNLSVDIATTEGLNKAVNVFNKADWAALQAAVPAENWVVIQSVLDKRHAAETFLGLSMVETAGLAWPGILIPILVAGTTLLSSWIMMRTNPNMNQQAKTQNYIMMIMMPIMMFIFTINISSGVGIYWIVSSVYQTVQQYFLNKYYRGTIKLETPPLKVVKTVKPKKG